MSPAKSPVAFAGLGAMGFGMASHLVKSGFPVIAYDIYPPSIDKLVAVGGRAAVTPRVAVRDVDFLVCMVPKIDDAMDLLFDPASGAVTSMRKNASLLITSTVAPADITMLLSRLEEAERSDIHLLDCPVSGGAGRAANGTLSIFASGHDAHLDTAHPILECMSSKLYRVPGGLGGGSKAKLIHQIFAGVNIAMASEAMGLAAMAGLNTQQAFDKLSEGDGSSWMFCNRVPHMLDPSLPPYSAIAIIKKDVAIITKTIREYSFRLPLLEKSEELYQECSNSGWEREDDCAVVRLYMPGQPELVAEHAKSWQGHDQPRMSINEIESLMTGVHLAVINEAMRFCERLGIDTDLMFDIVSNAAGSSAAFTKYFQRMQKDAWLLRSIPGVIDLRDRLVGSSHCHYHRCTDMLQASARAKASDLGYKMDLSSIARRTFQDQLS
ncbi:MAG: hypothetical protein OHK93_000002 [Ramalina farinacea]|uniref:3-hydroxyisobutyrate dehydrogenase n=1 Tax=Ramalina farinacea TaxID=258253 RepID=A0AA43QHM7_9LECA|nr:hypothetical protein [Ramalina farinacea]